MRQRFAAFLRHVADRLDPAALMAEGYAEQAHDALSHPGTVGCYTTTGPHGATVQYLHNGRWETGEWQ